jgi:hypothetical protein
MIPEVTSRTSKPTDKIHLLESVLAPLDEELVRKFYDLKITTIELELDDIRFLMNSHLAHWISCFQNSTKNGPKEHEIRYVQGRVAIKCRGQWESLSEIRKHLVYDAKKAKVVNSARPDEVWSYISPFGLVMRDQYDYSKLEPIEQLSQLECSAIREQAALFFTTHKEVDAGKEKKCVLQLLTTKHRSQEDRLCSAISDVTEHVGCRLIDERGRVYSFGLELENEQADSIFHSMPPFPFTAAKTIASTIASPDFGEFLKFHEKLITTIPLTKERLVEIVKFVEEQNKLKIRFNAIKQTCATFGREVLKKAGCSYPDRVPLRVVLYRFFVNQELIPEILVQGIQKIQNIFKVVSDFLETAIPTSIQHVVCEASSVLGYLPNKVVTVFCNTLVLIFGGWASDGKKDQVTGEDDFDNRQMLTSFSKLIRSPEDMFRDDLTESDQAFAISDWQLKQASTKTIKFSGILKMHF